jgi:hypothetical protein
MDRRSAASLQQHGFRHAIFAMHAPPLISSTKFVIDTSQARVLQNIEHCKSACSYSSLIPKFPFQPKSLACPRRIRDAKAVQQSGEQT